MQRALNMLGGPGAPVPGLELEAQAPDLLRLKPKGRRNHQRSPFWLKSRRLELLNFPPNPPWGSISGDGKRYLVGCCMCMSYQRSTGVDWECLLVLRALIRRFLTAAPPGQSHSNFPTQHRSGLQVKRKGTGLQACSCLLLHSVTWLELVLSLKCVFSWHKGWPSLRVSLPFSLQLTSVLDSWCSLPVYAWRRVTRGP